MYHVEVDCKQQCRCICDEVINHQIEPISAGVLQERGSNFCELASRTSAMRRDAGMNHKACISDAKGYLVSPKTMSSSKKQVKFSAR
jgi:hypothetical protein